MKHALAVFLVVLLAGAGVGCTGCVSSEVKEQAQLNEVRSVSFVELLNAGKTTREEEQDFIRSDAKAWKNFREALGLKAK